VENRSNILNELNEFSPLIAGIQKVNVFTVPNGYFERLAEGILMGVKEETGEVLNSITNPSLMQVPHNYFESLADNILNKIKGEEAGELSPMLNSIKNTNVFAVPQGYFESLADNILNKIKGEETAELSPMLYSIKNKNVFTVPQGYFESLAAKILDTVKPHQAKVVTMQRRTTTILKYALAAVFTGIMALGVYKFTGVGKPGQANLPGYVADGMKIKNVDEELAKVSDEEIIKYLQANGSDTDAALVANTIDENELPTQEDYLTDDKALDKYLDNIDLKDFKN